jgi:hypothetical protein
MEAEPPLIADPNARNGGKVKSDFDDFPDGPACFLDGPASGLTDPPQDWWMHWRTHLLVLFSSLSFRSVRFFELPKPLFPWHSFLKKRGPRLEKLFLEKEGARLETKWSETEPKTKPS